MLYLNMSDSNPITSQALFNTLHVELERYQTSVFEEKKYLCDIENNVNLIIRTLFKFRELKDSDPLQQQHTITK
jgi:hypothetical protein